MYTVMKPKKCKRLTVSELKKCKRLTVSELTSEGLPIWLAVHPSQPYVMSWYHYGNETMKLWNWDKGWECTRTFQISGKTLENFAFDPKETNRFAATAVGTGIFDTGVDVMVRLSILC
jgi:hypothetical protein